MCDPISAGMLLAGTAASVKGGSDAERRRGRAISVAERRRQESADKLSEVVDRLVMQYTPDERAITHSAGADQVRGAIDDAVNLSRETTGAGATFAGRTSGDFLRKAGERRAEEVERTAKIARLLGEIGGANRGRQTEGFKMADGASEIGQLSNFARGNSYVDGIRIDEAGRVNPLLAAAGGALSGAGSAGLSTGIGGAGGAAGAGGVSPSLAAGSAGSRLGGAGKIRGIVKVPGLR